MGTTTITIMDDDGRPHIKNLNNVQPDALSDD